MKKICLIFCMFSVFYSIWSQSDLITIDASKRSFEDVIMDIIIDKGKYHNKQIAIKSIRYEYFGVESIAPTTIINNPWAKDSDTFMLHQTKFMYANDFSFYIKPKDDDREAKKFFFGLKGKYFPATNIVSLIGRFYVHKQFGQELFLFVISELEIGNNKYSGVLPTYKKYD